MDQTTRNQGDDRLEATATEPIAALLTETDDEALVDQINDTLDALDDHLVDLQARVEGVEQLVRNVEAVEKRVARLEARLDAKRTNARVIDGYGDDDPVEIPEPVEGAEALTGPQAPDEEFSGGPK